MEHLENIGFKYRTSIFGKRSTIDENCNSNSCWNSMKNSWAFYQIMNCGIVILSKYKIIQCDCIIFCKHGCGFGALATKGVTYTKIEKKEDNSILHIFGTHIQADNK